jgi:hypothetical protein
MSAILTGPSPLMFIKPTIAKHVCGITDITDLTYRLDSSRRRLARRKEESEIADFTDYADADDDGSSRQSPTIDDIRKDLIMEVKSSRDTLAVIPAVMARAIHAIAEREGTSAAAVIKRMLPGGLGRRRRAAAIERQR